VEGCVIVHDLPWPASCHLSGAGDPRSAASADPRERARSQNRLRPSTGPIKSTDTENYVDR
jgi:hypothetical protein